MSLPPYLCDGHLPRRRPLPVPVTAVSLAVARLRSKPLRGPLGTAPRGAVLLVRSTVLQPSFYRLVVRCCCLLLLRLVWSSLRYPFISDANQKPLNYLVGCFVVVALLATNGDPGPIALHHQHTTTDCLCAIPCFALPRSII